MSRSFRNWLPRTRMGIFTALLILLWLLKTLVLPPSSSILSQGQQFSLDVITLLLFIPAVYYAVKGFSVVRRRLLWKIRRRLILAHIFIGAIPVLLGIVIIYVTGLLFYYQLSYYLIMNQIGEHLSQVLALNLTLRAGLEESFNGRTNSRDSLQATLDREAKYIWGTYPSASILMEVKDLNSGSRNLYAAGGGIPEERLGRFRVPGWVGDSDFSGLIMEDSQPDLLGPIRNLRGERVPARLFLRSVTSGHPRPDRTYAIQISVPFDQYLLERIKAALGQDLLLVEHVTNTGLNVMLQSTDLLSRNVVSATFDLERDTASVSRPVWSVLLFPISWATGQEEPRGDSEVLFVELSVSKLLQNVFRSESNVGRTIISVLKIVVGFFLGVELISIVIGIWLTKSITNAVHNLDRGTEFIKRGDFSHRIVVKSRDQLGSLAKSFNQMTEYIQTLVKERVQRERLERELEIAKEVQEQLFPRRAPHMTRMELTGLCLPARVVSGDYYDFMQFGTSQMAMALGDICGKGISAALLMANLQATLRSNVINLSQQANPYNDGAVAHIVKLLNQQIYSYTAANKFASFFYAVYEDDRSTLTYCNAGHNPPLYFSQSGLARLSVGGTVVGIFADAEFEQATLELKSGEVFLAYTDGIVESVNEYGEEFGEDRLISVVQRNSDLPAEDLQNVVIEEVLRWSYEKERDDDMTLIVARMR